ncbi:MAG: phycobilisome protein [Cyanobacteria bacterium P01_C01_bin.72]
MITDIESLIYQAEAEHLSSKDLGIFKSQILYLEERLQVYEQIRAQEAEIFQHVADQLLHNFPQQSEEKIKRALKHWLLVIRCCAMAMLSNEPLYLEQRILEWLPEQIAAHQMQELEQNLANYLLIRCKKVLGTESFSIIQPYLEQSKTILLTSP